MRGGGGGGGNPQGDQITNFFWLIVLVAGICILLWWQEQSLIVRFVFMVRTYEIFILKFFSDLYNGFAFVIGTPRLPVERLTDLELQMWSADPTQVPFRMVANISDAVGAWLRFPMAILLVGMGLFLYFTHGNSRFRQTYDAQMLRKAEAENWPQITPVLNLDLVHTDINQGPWAMAQQPIDFARTNGLLEIIKDTKSGKELFGIKRGPAHRIFVMQLGPLWRGARALPIHLQALLVIFCARALRERAVADRFITQISASAKEIGHLNFSGITEQLAKYEKSNLIAWVTKRHAYTSTCLGTLLAIARVDGVLASAEFLWLKPVDRRMWYMLNCVGRQTAFPEVGGVFAHWLAEKKVGRALRVPMVKEAVNALDIAVKEILYVPEGDEWHHNAG